VIVRGASTLAVCLVALLGASTALSGSAAPAAGPGYVASIQFSYDSPPSPDTRHRVSVDLEGEVCGDAFDNEWTFVGQRSGGPTNLAPTLSTVTFSAANPATITGDRWSGASGAEIARIDFLLRFTPGAPPVLTAQWETTGDITNVIATPPQVRATAQAIADCPAARPPPAPSKGTPTGGPAAGYPPGRVKLPGQGRFSRIVPGQPLPFGTVVDVSNGRGVALTDGKQGKLTISGQRDGVPSIVKLVRAGRVVELQLTRGDLGACSKPARRLWANGKGNFRVRGRYASVSKGRWWLTTDYCDRTVIQARTGSVLVRDLVTNKSVVVKAPDTYIARRKR
jgi:hypothetical protein